MQTMNLMKDCLNAYMLRHAYEHHDMQKKKRRRKRVNSFSEAVERFRNAALGEDVREALTDCLLHLEQSLNVDLPQNCPNCGAAYTGRSANCEYCGTLLIWKNRRK